MLNENRAGTGARTAPAPHPSRRAPQLKHPEWVLFYRQGVSVEQIARLNDRPVAGVRAYLGRVSRRFPDLVAGRLYWHDRPTRSPEGWVNRDRAWKVRLGELARFVGEQGRRPDRCGDGTAEDRLAHWLTSQRSAHRKGRLPGHRARWLDEALPDWRTDTRTLANAVAWRLRLAEVVAFRAEHGRLPRRGRAGAEHNLGMWLAVQRRDIGVKREERRVALDAQLPGWGGPARGA